MRLDRLIGKHAQIGRRETRALLAQGSVVVDGRPETDPASQITPFHQVELDGRHIHGRQARYLMLHKPAGILSATSDPEHPTVIDLITEPWSDELHLAGRLDRATTGLVILTNDSRFSEALTAPQKKIPKVYLVTTDTKISDEAVAAFESGMHFAKEKITTQPAKVDRLEPRRCKLTIYEGKHHQVKRMFARFDIRVTDLHREVMGNIVLDPSLAPGEYRSLADHERSPIAR